jgi:hypothetical protein
MSPSSLDRNRDSAGEVPMGSASKELNYLKLFSMRIKDFPKTEKKCLCFWQK